MEVTIVDAAVRLGVTPRQAQRLAAAGRLQVVRRVGRTLLVEDTSVTELARTTGPGRRWNARTAWAAIEMLECVSTDRVTGSTASRLRRRRPALEEMLALSGRSALVVPTVAARLGLSAGDANIVEGYLLRDRLAAVRDWFGLVADADGEVFLRVTDHAPVASLITTALDLAERGATRERAAAYALLGGVLSGAQREEPHT